METFKIFIITGNQGEGKTTFLKQVLQELSWAGIKTTGFYAEGKWENNQRTAFEIVNVQGGEQRLLCCDKETAGFEKAGRFYFDPRTIRWGENLLGKAGQRERCLFVLDEIGKFELAQKVWYPVFFSLLTEKRPLLITVRKEILEVVIQYFRIRNPFVFGLDDAPHTVARTIAGHVGF